jgi:hypothetical protein
MRRVRDEAVRRDGKGRRRRDGTGRDAGGAAGREGTPAVRRDGKGRRRCGGTGRDAAISEATGQAEAASEMAGSWGRGKGFGRVAGFVQARGGCARGASAHGLRAATSCSRAPRRAARDLEGYVTETPGTSRRRARDAWNSTSPHETSHPSHRSAVCCGEKVALWARKAPQPRPGASRRPQAARPRRGSGGFLHGGAGNVTPTQGRRHGCGLP